MKLCMEAVSSPSVLIFVLGVIFKKRKESINPNRAEAFKNNFSAEVKITLKVTKGSFRLYNFPT